MPFNEDALDSLTTALSDRYAVEKEIGRGGMATVYLAEDLKHRRRVAIKVLEHDLAKAIGAERFLREIQTTANLRHPHILPLHDSGEASGFLYYVMPFVDGESLRSRIERERRLPVEDSIRIAVEVADALGFAHGQGVVHRDVKPANILLEAGHAILADFGIAHVLADAEDTRLTKSGTSLGTPSYMSPEQATGEEDLDGRSDQYSLGCVLYEMLAGSPPFSGPSAQAVLLQHVTKEPLAIGTLRPAVPDHVSAALVRALSKSRADRFRTASEFTAALAGDKRLVGVGGGARTWWGRWKAPVFAGSFVIALTAAAAVWWFSPRASSPFDTDLVAVAPFRNLTGDPELDAVGQMASVLLTQGLQKTGLVRVVDPEMVLSADFFVQSQFEEGLISDRLAAFASEIGAGTVVFGSYVLEAGEIHLDARITDVGSGSLIQALEPIRGPADYPRSLLLDLQPKVMGALAVAFDDALTPFVDRVGSVPTWQASQEFLRGIRLYLQEMDWDAAVEEFLRAHASDSTFYTPLVYASWAVTNISTNASRMLRDSILDVLSQHIGDLTPYEAAVTRSFLASDREGRVGALGEACSIAPGSKACYNYGRDLYHYLSRPERTIEVFTAELEPEKGWMRGWRGYYITLGDAYHAVGEFSKQLEFVRRGRELYPTAEALIRQTGQALVGLGRVDEVMAFLSDTLPSLSPPPSYLFGTLANEFGFALKVHGYHEEAERAFEAALESWEALLAEDPSYLTARNRIGWASYHLRRLDRAQEQWEHLFRETGNPGYRAFTGLLAALRGDEGEAREIIRWLDEVEGPTPGYSMTWQAWIAAELGEREEALSILKARWEHLDVYGMTGPYRYTMFPALRGYAPYEEWAWPGWQ